MSAPPLGMKQPPREEPTEDISFDETTLQEEREQPVISKGR